MRHLATIQRIDKLTPIEGADKIETAQILGWEVVVKKGEFQVGDLCCYIEIDSLLPDIPIFDFMRSRKFRVRTIKLKGQISQGLALPLTDLLKIKNPSFYHLKEGDDLTNLLGIKKYDPQAEQEDKLRQQLNKKQQTKIEKQLMRMKWYRNFYQKHILKTNQLPFPSFIKKTDEVRIQNKPHLLQDKEIWSVTEKLDGCSATYFMIREKKKIGKDKFKFGVCSRNLQLYKNNSHYWKIAEQFDIEKVLKSYLEMLQGADYVVLQGEIIGEGIQQNKYGIKGLDFYAYNLIDKIDGVETHFSSSSIVYKLNTILFSNIKIVPILSPMRLFPTVQEMVEHSKGQSVLTDIQREGIVVRKCNDPTQSFKVINPEFLLEYKE